MKRLIFIGLIFLYLQGFSQTRPIAEIDLPSVVFQGFERAYPDLPQRTWEQRNTRFVAIVRYETHTESAIFLETGEWVETRQDMEQSELPEIIITFINDKYAAYRIQSIQYVEESNGGMYYEILLSLRSNRNITTELIFDIGGQIKMVDGLPVYETADGQIITREDENARIRPGTQREVIDENQGIPENILQNLRRRYGAVENIEWTTTEFGFHRGAFRFRDENIATEWDNEGNQVSVITFFNRRNAPPLIQQFLDQNYSRSRFISGERIVYESRFLRAFPEMGLRNYFVIEISNRPRGVREQTFYRIYFDNTGQLDMIVQREE
ncbi:MAG: PepSY-like domain-containing protein [Bacteroidales bacterium]|nr:PepSY-like domain-containing protein [Bacteroidales bacterium]